MRTATVVSAPGPVSSDGASQVAILHHISSIVSSDLSLEKMLSELVALTYETTNCDACLVYLVDRATNEIVLRASQLPHTEEIGNIRLKMGEGITGWVAQHKSVVALVQQRIGGCALQGFSDRCRKIPTRPFFRCRW